MNIIYEKAKGLSVKWTIEDFVGNHNIHKDQHPNLQFFECTSIFTSKINPIKNYYDLFPDSEIIACVKLFNTSTKLDMKLLVKSTNQSKNNYYFKELQSQQLRIFLSLLLTGTARV